MNNALGKNFNFTSLILFTLPNIIMMIFLSLYTIVDGIFISRFVGTVALSATNMSFPVTCVEMAIGIMLATGGSAVIARQLGEGDIKRAKKNFTFIVTVSFVVGVIIAVVCNIFLDNILIWLGTSSAQFEYCKSYTRILLIFAPAFFLQTVFQTLFVTAGKPLMGLIVIMFAGIANMVFDYVFIVLFKMGIDGAAYATVIGYLIPAVSGILYFLFNKNGSLHFVKFNIDVKMLLKACGNGSSEMVTNIANAVTTFLFNLIFMKFYGEDGVASITIVLYFQFVFQAVFFGFSMGTAPVFSFKYGSNDIGQIKQCFKNSIIFILICAVLSYGSSIILIKPALGIFTIPGTNVYNITLEGFPLFALSFVIMGISIFASSMFTAFSDGKVSAVISMGRTFVFLVGSLLILPVVIGKTGAWLAVPTAELMGVAVSIYYLIVKKVVYKY